MASKLVSQFLGESKPTVIDEATWSEKDIINAIVGACGGSQFNVDTLRKGLGGLSKSQLKKVYHTIHPGEGADEIDIGDEEKGEEGKMGEKGSPVKKMMAKKSEKKEEKKDAKDEKK